MSQSLSRRLLLAAVPAAAVVTSAPAIAASNPDADLLRLGAQFEAEWAKEVEWFASNAEHPDDAGPQAIQPCGVLAERINRSKAHTLEGLRVKARAIAWCVDDGSRFDLSNLLEAPTQDFRLAGSIIRDLLAVGRSVI